MRIPGSYFLTVCFALVFLSGTGPGFAATPQAVVALSSPKVAAGQNLEFAVYLHNRQDYEIQVDLPWKLACVLTGGKTTTSVQAKLVQPRKKTLLAIEPGCFVEILYSLSIPEAISGYAQLEIRHWDTPPVFLAVHVQDEKSETEYLTQKSFGSPKGTPSLDELITLYQPYLGNLGAYKPMYFLVGADPEQSKFQFSFQYRFFNEDNPLAQTLPWLPGIHFAYTQTSFWDLQSESAPFKDTSYKPEMFFLTGNAKKRPDWMRGLFLQTGFQHESNGRGGEFSRSTNFLYAKPVCILYDPDTRIGASFAPRFHAYILNEDETNPDLEDYRGYFDFEFSIGHAGGLVLTSSLRWAKEGGSIETDLTYPLHRLSFENINMVFHVQYVNALAESLLHYQERNEAVRLGFSFVR